MNLTSHISLNLGTILNIVQAAHFPVELKFIAVNIMENFIVHDRVIDVRYVYHSRHILPLITMGAYERIVMSYWINMDANNLNHLVIGYQVVVTPALAHILPIAFLKQKGTNLSKIFHFFKSKYYDIMSWNFGSLLAIYLLILLLLLIVIGAFFFVSFHYTPFVDFSLNSLELVMIDINTLYLALFI
jgi:hypothetical protein